MLNVYFYSISYSKLEKMSIGGKFESMPFIKSLKEENVETDIWIISEYNAKDQVIWILFEQFLIVHCIDLLVVTWKVEIFCQLGHY